MDLVGVNTAGASFGHPGSTDSIGTTHTYTAHGTIDYYASKGMDVIRLDLKWERVQRDLGGPLDETEMTHVDDVIAYARSKGVAVIVSLHNFGKYEDALIGSAAVPTSAFVDVWDKLASRYQDSPNVIFGLMNEPHAHSATQWLPIANSAIKAIRDAGAAQEILVPGTYWDGAHSWVSSDNDTVIGAGIVDPLKNFAFEVHQYLDHDSSGTHFDVVSETIGVERLEAVTAWARETGNRLFLGEFGVATDATSLKALDNMLAYMTEHRDVWQGATYWAGGEWWGDYPFAVQPINGQDRPQMDVLDDYVSPQARPYWEAPVPLALHAPAAPALEAPSPPRSIGTGSDALVLKLSEDAYKGSARFTVSVDGRQIGDVQEAHASRAAGQHELLEIRGNWGIGRHEVAVTFLNDAWDGTAATDRNLYLDGATLNGAAVAGAKLDLLSGGAQHFAFHDDTAVAADLIGTRSIGRGADTLVLKFSEDAYEGDARFTVSVDGRQVGGVQDVRASRHGGQYEVLEVKGNWGVGKHDVAINFLNDAWGGHAAADRNLYVDGAAINGLSIAGARLDLLGGGSQHFVFEDATEAVGELIGTRSIGTGADTLVLKLSEDAYQGDARFTVSVDGRQIGDIQEARASRQDAEYEVLEVRGDWGVGRHDVAITFLNDAWGGTAATDRNLYLESATFNGAGVTGAKLDLMSAGSGHFTFHDSVVAGLMAQDSLIY
jgi:aryl-phospho-beta-D-glucosidase BglC (GH1 family)